MSGKQVPKMSARVVNAIRNLREVHGSTSKEIMSYIKSHCNVPEIAVQRQMQAALKRGLEYGILKKTNGHYFLNTEAGEPQLAIPVERARRRARRRRRSRRRRSRRRRSRRRRSSRRRRGRRRSNRGRTHRRSGGVNRRSGCTNCRCTKRSREANALSNNILDPQIQALNSCACEKESNLDNQSRESKSCDDSLSRSRSSANSDRDGPIDDQQGLHDQE